MKGFIISVLIIMLVVITEFRKSMGAIVLPIIASLILLIWSITFWFSIEKKYTILFVWTVSIYTVGTLFNVIMYN